MPVKKKPVIEEPVVDDFVEQNIPLLIGTKLSTGTPSSWFVVNNEGDGETHFAEICHSKMAYATKGKWDELYTAVPKDNEMEIAYIRMLIHGPFKAYSDLISLEKHGKGYVLHVTDLDKIPANILYNFVVASRVTLEHPQLIKPWYEGVELGFDPVLSFLLSYSTNGQPFNGKRTFNGSINQTNHFWFDKLSEWERIIRGDFVVGNVSKDSYKVNPGACRPTNKIWGMSKDYEKFTTLEAVAIAEKLNLPIEPSDPIKPAARPKKAVKPSLYGANPFLQPHFNNIFVGLNHGAEVPVGMPQPIGNAPPLVPNMMQANAHHMLNMMHDEFQWDVHPGEPWPEPPGDPQPIIEEIEEIDEPFDWDEDEPDFD
jgi:hypothetical protein